MEQAVDIFIPYKANLSNWQELKYALRSIDKNFTSPFRLVIVGDKPPWMKGDFVHIKHERDEGKDGTNTYDAVSKLIKYMAYKGGARSFIRWYDDIYLMKPVGVSTHQRLIARNNESEISTSTGSGVWQHQLRKTIAVCRTDGYSTWNYETHLPRYFERNKMALLLYKYNAQDDRLLTATLYYNKYFSKQTPELCLNGSGIRAAFYGDETKYSLASHSFPEVMKALKENTWCNHNNEGLTDALKKALQIYFPKPSRWE